MLLQYDRVFCGLCRFHPFSSIADLVLTRSYFQSSRHRVASGDALAKLSRPTLSLRDSSTSTKSGSGTVRSGSTSS